MEKINLTENEKALLIAIRDSEYNDDHQLAAVWVNCLWGFEGTKKFGGVMASVSTKGLAKTDGECAWLTELGLATVNEATAVQQPKPVIRLTGKAATFRGRRFKIWQQVVDGMTVEAFLLAVKPLKGGQADLNIYLEKGLVTVR